MNREVINELDLVMIEKKLQKESNERNCERIRRILEEEDYSLFINRDKDKYKIRGKRSKTIKTIFGNVTYMRRIYKLEKSNVNKKTKKHVFLLDEKIKIANEIIGNMSPYLSEIIVDSAIDVSYRKTSKQIKQMYQYDISHQGVWSVLQSKSEKIKSREDEEIKKSKEGTYNKEVKKVEIIFQEIDGCWINIKNEKKKKELKLGIFYEGNKKRSTSKNCDEYETINKKVYTAFESKRFFEINDAILINNYDIDYLKFNILNADGANWIKGGMLSNVIYQIDRFHINQAIVRAYKGINNKTKKLIRMIKKKKVKEVIEIVRRDLKKYSTNKYIYDLYTYLRNNEPYILRYNERGLDIPKPPAGVYYRNLGTMEHNICDVIAQRMKNNKTSWSLNGAENMARIRAERYTKKKQ